MKELLVIANLGRIRCVKFRQEGEDPIEQEHLMEDATTAVEEHRVTRGEVVTDQSGRFGRSAPAGEGGGMSYGEQHNLNAELERKALQSIAGKIGKLVAEEGNRHWSLAAPQPILRRLEKALPAACRAALVQTIGADLTKESLAKLEKRFGIGG